MIRSRGGERKKKNRRGKGDRVTERAIIGLRRRVMIRIRGV